MKRWILIGMVSMMCCMILQGIAEARNEQAQRVSSNPDPGFSDVKDPAIAVLDGITVIAYVRDAYVPGPGENYRLILKVSNDYGNLDWSNKNGLYISSGISRNQRRPDVTIVKMCKSFDPFEEEIVVFVTWQEYNSSKMAWEVWVSNATIDPTVGDGTITQKWYQQPVLLSSFDEIMFDAINPRINGSYLPPRKWDKWYHSSTMVMVVYQQEFLQNRYCINQTHMAYDYNDNPYGNNADIQWPHSVQVANMGSGDGYNFENPSIDTYPSPGSGASARMGFAIVCDEQYLANNYGVTCKIGKLTLIPDESVSLQYEILDHYVNMNSPSYGYPDVAIRKDGTTYRPVVVWQSSLNQAMAKEIYHQGEVTLGPCKAPSMRGISIDDSPPQYKFINNDDPVTKAIRRSWINPGGFQVIWRSDTDKPEGGTYGIDSLALEFKNNSLRICHDYRGTNGTDDTLSGNYIPIPIYHETTNPSDTYLTLATDNTGQGMVSWLRNGDEIWSFKLVDYTD